MENLRLISTREKNCQGPMNLGSDSACTKKSLSIFLCGLRGSHLNMEGRAVQHDGGVRPQNFLKFGSEFTALTGTPNGQEDTHKA
jgi:hypothetical protein